MTRMTRRRHGKVNKAALCSMRLAHTKQFGGCFPQHCPKIRIVRTRRGKDVIHRRTIPWEWGVGPHKDLAHADLRNQMPHRFRCEYDGIVIELPQVFGRVFLERHRCTAVGKSRANSVRSRSVRAQMAAAMGRANLEPGKAVERSFEDQVR